jgi:tRNA(fMet)-specific endonuclease VapC
VRYLIDSDWIIDALIGVPTVVATFNDLRQYGVAVSVITLAEVFEGAYHNPVPTARLADIRRLLAGYTVLDVTEAIGGRFAQERAVLRRQGRMISDLDLLIAATALTRGLALVTRNIQHFERIQGLTLYRDPGQT